jgi:hypothetical protein
LKLALLGWASDTSEEAPELADLPSSLKPPTFKSTPSIAPPPPIDRQSRKGSSSSNFVVGYKERDSFKTASPGDRESPLKSSNRLRDVVGWIGQMRRRRWRKAEAEAEAKAKVDISEANKP